MDKKLAVYGGLGLGAGLMYVLDPEAGRRRRKRALQKVSSLVRRSDEVVGKTARDLSNRTRGLVHQAARRVRGRNGADDETIAARVRAKLGRHVSHPSAVEVGVEDGRVIVSGAILAAELQDAIAAVRGVPGVHEVVNALEAHEEPDGVPALQGGQPPAGEPFEFMHENWSPTARLLASALGGGLAFWGARRGDAVGTAVGSLGLGLALRSVTNTELSRLAGLGAGRRAVDVQKTIHINAPVEHVFALWSNYQNFPLFMSHLRDVRDLGNGRSRWLAEGPGGVPLEWEAELTGYEPNELIGWRTLRGSLVKSAGRIRFEPSDGGGTRVEVRMSYNPPAGAIGHALATLLGADPKRQMDDDLLRMKTFVETGVIPHDAAEQAATVGGPAN